MSGNQNATPMPLTVNVPTLHDIATNNMPQIADDLTQQGKNMTGLLPGAVFGSTTPGASSLGNGYQSIVEAITMLAGEFSANIRAGAQTLNTIAGNYHTTDRSIAGN